jgi:hypothetical protein
MLNKHVINLLDSDATSMLNKIEHGWQGISDNDALSKNYDHNNEPASQDLIGDFNAFVDAHSS